MLWITLNARKSLVCCKDTETERQTICKAVWELRKNTSFLWRNTRELEGESCDLLWSHMTESSPLSFHHLFFPLFLFWFHSFDSLLNLALVKRDYRESCWVCVHGWQHKVRWLSQKGMLIRQPKLKLIWLATVKPSPCLYSELRLFPPPHCSTASVLSVCLQTQYFIMDIIWQNHLIIQQMNKLIKTEETLQRKLNFKMYTNVFY